MSDFDDIANAAFEQELPVLRYALFDVVNLPILCRICDGNHWTVERVLEDGIQILTCSHGTVDGLGFRQVDSVRSDKVFRAEELEFNELS